MHTPYPTRLATAAGLLALWCGVALAATPLVRLPPRAPASTAAPASSNTNPQAPKYTPFKLLAVSSTPTGVLLTWDGLPGTREYQVWRAPPDAGKPQQQGTTRGDVTHWAGPVPIGKAFYWVESIPMTGSGMGQSNHLLYDPALNTGSTTTAVPMATPSKPMASPPVPPRALLGAPPAGPVPPPPTAAPATSGPTDVLDKPFSLDGKPPQRESFGFGLTSAGTVQVVLHWQGGPVTVSLRPANGNAIASKPMNSGKDVASFAVSPAQVAQSLIWFIDVAAPGVAQGQVHIVSPKPDTAKMNAAMADAKAKSAQQQLSNPPSLAQAQVAARARLVAMQRSKADAETASHQRIRTRLQLLVATKGSANAPANAGGASAAPVAVRAVKLGNVSNRGPAGLLGKATPSGISGSMSDSPMASTYAPQAVFPNTTLTLDGLRFRPDDEAWLIWPSGSEVRAQKTYVSNTRIQLQIPGYTQSATAAAQLYFKYVRNGQTQRTDEAWEIVLQPTTPVINSVALADPNDPGPIRPQKIITVTGSGFAPNDAVYFVLQNKEYLAEPWDSSFNSDKQLTIKLPSVVKDFNAVRPPDTPMHGAFAEAQQVSVFIKRGNLISNRTTLTLEPELVLTQANLALLPAKNDSRDFKDQGPNRLAVIDERNDFGSYVDAIHETGVFTGVKGDDVIFATATLKNRWMVREVRLDAIPWNCNANATLTESFPNSAKLYAKVHWWADAGGVNAAIPNPAHTRYFLSYIIEGPIGMPYK